MKHTNEYAELMAKQVQSGKTAHAYLLVGPRGTGKTTVARILAKSLNCSKLKANGDPCDKCSNCVSIKEGSFIDLIEIDAASNRGIDDIRDLKDKIRLAPTMGKNKVYIIDEVHMLTTEAFNALLKTLEEPPSKTTFILCTTEEHKVPATIKSRCQTFKFKRPTIKQIVAVLKEVAQGEDIKISEDDLTKIAEASMGDYRGASVLLEQVHEGDVNVDTLLSLSSKKKYVECVGYLLDSKVSNALDIVSEVYHEGIDLYVWVGELLKYLRTMLFIKSGVSDAMTDVTAEVLEEVEEQAKKVNTKWLVRATNILLEAHKNIRSSFIPQLPVEIAVVEICSKDSGSEDFKKDKTPEDSPTSIGSRGKGITLSKEEETTVEFTKTKKGIVSGVKKVVKSEVSVKSVKNDKPLVPFKDVKSKWEKFVKDSKELNHSLTALLNLCKPVDVEGKFVVVEVFYPFHKERLESARTRKLIEGLSDSVFGQPLSFKCVLSDEKPKKLKKSELEALTDLNVIVPSGVDGKSIIEAFDGGLPIVG
ncbi:DNA polymerase III subunit gamma/tau [Patescibacteria group bacterium]|nr:DNA polymerase III subunit gamma/tau [Patescibacteria group bacterium]